MVFATSEDAPYSISYDLSYTVEADGKTKAKQDITITNEVDGIHVPEYSIMIGSNSITDIIASDNFGLIEPVLTKIDNSTKIDLVFNDLVVGRGKSRKVTLKYSTPDFAFIKGKIMEAGFPLFVDAERLKDYLVTVRVAKKFGEVTEIFPIASRTQTTSSYYEFYYDYQQLAGYTGINATFGREQLYDFNIRYTITNPNDVKGRTEIALPPDTNFQQLIYEDIEPRPENITVDMNGNWLAEYMLRPNSTIEIAAAGKAKIMLSPREEFARELSSDEIDQFTKGDEYWQISDPDAQALAKKLKTPEAIYNYLVDEFIYDYGRLDGDIKRFGSEYALDNPNNAICMEFTDTFIALTRLLGVPAREHNGYAYTENNKLRPLSLSQDVLHAWPEYYDSESKQWIQVDPTWGNSTGGVDYFHKFDLDHFSFVIHGDDNSYPVTAGAYKTDATKGKDIEVTFADSFEPVEKVELSATGFVSGYTGVPVTGEIKVVNVGNVAVYDVDVEITVRKNGESYQENLQTLDVVPPLAWVSIPVDLNTAWTDYGGKYEFVFDYGGQSVSKVVDLKPIIKLDYIIWAFGGIIGGVMWSSGYYQVLVRMQLDFKRKLLLRKEMLQTDLGEGVRSGLK